MTRRHQVTGAYVITVWRALHRLWTHVREGGARPGAAYALRPAVACCCRMPPQSLGRHQTGSPGTRPAGARIPTREVSEDSTTLGGPHP
jgi:hypothetical protein